MEEEKMSIGGIFSLLHYGCIKDVVVGLPRRM